MYVRLTRCEGKLHNQYLPEVSSTRQMHNVCLWMNESINEKMSGEYPGSCIWCLTNNGSAHTVKMEVPWGSEWWWGGQRLPQERVSPSTAPSRGSDTEAPGQGMPKLVQGTSKERSAFFPEGITQNPIKYCPCSQDTPGFQLLDSLCHSSWSTVSRCR